MDIADFLRDLDRTELLRFATAGSVDDGKSTLIGRLLLATRSVFRDQIASVESASLNLNREETDLAMFTDGLKAEREQAITIDVAYRQFRTGSRRFIIADAPGHEQYTRNMVTGASTASLAVILLDARLGVVRQSRRHAFIASLLGIPRVLVLVNKMDLVDYSQSVFEEVQQQYEDFCRRLDVKDISYIPISALRGDNVVGRSPRTPWYQGLPFLSHLERVYAGSDTNLIDLRFPVQLVLRPNAGFRGYAGKVASGVVRVGEKVMALPSGSVSSVTRILVGSREVGYAFPPQSVVLCLADEIDVSRGHVFVHPANLPLVESDLEAMLVWMGDQPLSVGKSYLIKHTTRMVRGHISSIHYRVEPDDLHRRPADTLALNEIGRVDLSLQQPLIYDEYRRNRSTGSLIIIDPLTNATVGAGMIIERSRRASSLLKKLRRAAPTLEAALPQSRVAPEDRSRLLNQRPLAIWLTGLSGAGKSSIAYALEKRLLTEGRLAYVRDGDNVRHGLNTDLGYSAADRSENIRRAAELTRLFVDAGLIVITAFISPFREDRLRARGIVGSENFVEVFVDAPLEVCESRDVKGLYQKARANELSEVTGISSPYEPPEAPEVHVRTDQLTIDETIEVILGSLEEMLAGRNSDRNR
jgi:bifunctional enzyme CysN/CysC